MLGELLVHPRAALEAAGEKPSLGAGGTAVVVSGVTSALAALGAVALGGGGTPAVVLSLALPLMLAAYWVLSALLVGAGARLMGRAPRRRDILAVSGLTFPPLVLYQVVALLQAAATHAGSGALSTAAGWLALPVVGWFVVLNVLAVRAVYDLPAMSATAVALLPYAALSGALLVLVVALSALHTAGVI